jgi:hypothetical protein
MILTLHVRARSLGRGAEYKIIESLCIEFMQRIFDLPNVAAV